MNIRKLPALALAVMLQIFPVCRVACVNPGIAPSGFAIVMRWLAGAVALLGSYHAVSGASAAIVGVASWTKITNGAQAGPVVTSFSAAAAQPLLYKIIITTPATTGAQYDYYNYDKLPPGLTMNTNVGGADGLGDGFIAGTPTQGGTYTVNLIAGNTLWPQTVTKAILITITGSGPSPPGITTPPVSQTVTAGTNVTFRVTATGTTLSYSWKFDTVPIAGATTSVLQLLNVQTTNSGTYSVIITNTAGSTNASATLTVNPAAPPPPMVLSNLLSVSGSVSFDVTGPSQTNYVLWSSTNLALWSPVATNFSSTGTVHFTDTNMVSPTKFYRATLGP